MGFKSLANTGRRYESSIDDVLLPMRSGSNSEGVRVNKSAWQTVH